MVYASFKAGDPDLVDDADQTVCLTMEKSKQWVDERCSEVRPFYCQIRKLD